MDVTRRETAPGEAYLHRKTIIMGDVNSGKTHYTQTIVEALCHRGLAGQIILLDLAPETTAGIGGKMAIPHPDILVLSPTVQPPRLKGRDSAHILQLAQNNARLVDPLLERAMTSHRMVLVVNDASLYLQAGSLERFLALLDVFPTVVINAYAGNSFTSAPFTEIERSAVLAVSRACDQVIEL